MNNSFFTRIYTQVVYVLVKQLNYKHFYQISGYRQVQRFISWRNEGFMLPGEIEFTTLICRRHPYKIVYLDYYDLVRIREVLLS